MKAASWRRGKSDTAQKRNPLRDQWHIESAQWGRRDRGVVISRGQDVNIDDVIMQAVHERRRRATLEAVDARADKTCVSCARLEYRRSEGKPPRKPQTYHVPIRRRDIHEALHRCCSQGARYRRLHQAFVMSGSPRREVQTQERESDST